jgi:cytochrome P450
MLERYGEPCTLRTYPVGPLVVVFRPDSVRALLTGDAETFQAGRANGAILPILEPDSLLRADGERHRRRRHLLAPAFRAASVDGLADRVVGQTQAAIERWPIGRPFALLPSLRTITLEVILGAIISVPEQADHAELAWRVRRLLGPAALAAIWLGNRPRTSYSPARVFEHHRQALHVLVRREIQRRRQHAGENSRGDVLDRLMAGRDENDAPLDDRAICDEVVTLLIAGHETTAIALAWMFERLVRHPAVLAQARRATTCGDTGFLDAVVKESLRTRPPLLDTVRMVTRPVALAGRTIPAGAVVMVSIPLVHRREDTYPDAQELRPERFLGTQPAPSDWVPFGGGARRCLGADLALMEMTHVLATVLARTDLEADRVQHERARLLGTALVPSRRGTIIVTGRLS